MNLQTVNDLTKNNQTSLPDAAQQTWAFAQASGKGFATVCVLDSDGTPGNYTSVDVVFLP
jgi:serine/threonine protein phosphatase PrpC